MDGLVHIIPEERHQSKYGFGVYNKQPNIVIFQASLVSLSKGVSRCPNVASKCEKKVYNTMGRPVMPVKCDWS